METHDITGAIHAYLSLPRTMFPNPILFLNCLLHSATVGLTPSLWGLRFQTGCGQRLIEAELEYENQVMIIRFRHVPGEIDFFVDSLLFQEGNWTKTTAQ